MRTHTRQTRPIRIVFCLLITSVLLCLTVFAAVPENGVNAPMLGDSHSAANHSTQDRGTARNRSGDTGLANAVTDAAGAVGDVVSDAGDAVSEVVGDIGNAAGEVVSDAGDAIGDAADAIGGTVDGAIGDTNGNAGVNNGTGANGEPSADGTVTGNQNSTADNNAGTAKPFDTHSAENTTGASGTVTKEDTPAGMSWILILILIAAAAAIFFLILMPKRSRDM